MAFGDIGSGAIMFISVTLMTVLVAGIFGAQVNEATYSAVQKQKHLSNQMQTDITIQHVYYESEQVFAYIKNSGDTAMRPEEFTIFVNNDFFRADGANSSAVIVADTDTINTGILDPDETVLITSDLTLSSGQHIYRVVTQYNTKHSKIFTS